ncbi:MAG: hypothetical protein WCQ53_06065, partial [bacterium]
VRTEVDTNMDGKPDKIGKTQIQDVYKFDIEDIENPKKKEPTVTTETKKKLKGKKLLKAKKPKKLGKSIKGKKPLKKRSLKNMKKAKKTTPAAETEPAPLQ